MLDQTFRELSAGFTGGLVGSILCYPFDTIKTRIQTRYQYSLIKDLKLNGGSTLWKGLSSPLTSIVIEKSLLFSSFHFFHNNQTVNQYYQLNAFLTKSEGLILKLIRFTRSSIIASSF